MSTSSPLPDGAEQVPVPIAIPTTTASVPAVPGSRHGRAADALISSYLRELLVDDAPATTAVPADDTASDEPATLI
jgi:hypothetical protein